MKRVSYIIIYVGMHIELRVALLTELTHLNLSNELH